MKPHSRPRPPNGSPEYFDQLERLIKTIDNENKELYLLGDLNCDLLKTVSDTHTKCDTQLIKQATRVTVSSASLIDHIATNKPERISDCGGIHGEISDHSLIFATRKIKVCQKKKILLKSET